jgi:hypothetical protein
VHHFFAQSCSDIVHVAIIAVRGVRRAAVY